MRFHYEVWFAVLLGVAVLEMLLAGLWVRFYFRFGLPIFFVERPLSGLFNELPSVEQLESSLASKTMSPLVFRAFGPTEYAFREKAITIRLLSYTPIMHGLLRLEPLGPSVKVIGVVNWFTVCFVVFSFLAAIEFDWRSLPLFVLVLVGGIYWLQARRYRTVCDRASRLIAGEGPG